MKKITIICLFLFTCCFLFSYYYGTNDAFGFDGMLIPVGNDIYDLTDSLFISSGKGLPSTSRPWTTSEARNELKKLNRESLTLEEQKIYDSLWERLNSDKENDISLTVYLSPEVYTHTNSNYNRDEYWNYGYEKRNHFALLALDNSTGGFYGHLELSGGLGLISNEDSTSSVELKDYVQGLGKPWVGVGTDYSEADGYIKVITEETIYKKNFVFNIPSLTNSDMNMPRRAYLDYAGKNFSLGIYKAQKVWGHNKGGNFIFDEHNDYYNTATLKTFAPSFSFEYTWMFPESYLGGVNPYKKSNASFFPVFWAHRVEFRAFDKFNMALSENLMCRFEDFPDFGTLNPATFYHNNVNNNQFNAIAHIEASYSIFPNWLIYGQFVVDQGSFPGFEDPTTEDQAMGFSLGAEYNAITNSGIFSLSLEGIYTTPVLYRPTASSDFIIHYNFINPEDYYRHPFFTYIGFEHGGDTILLRTDFDYRINKSHLYSSFEVLIKGEYTAFDAYHLPMMLSTPSGDAKVNLLFNIGGEHEFNIPYFPTNTFVDIALMWNKSRGFDLQLSLGATIKYNIV